MRTRAALLAILFFLLSACGSTAGSPDVESASGTSNGGAAAGAKDLGFTSTTVAGASFDGESLAGKPTVFWFWAPWCSACRGQIGGVSALAEKHEDAVNVVGVGGLDDTAAIADFAEEVSSKVTMLSDDKGSVWRHFGVKAQSTYLVLDASGEQVASGYLDDAELAEVVDDLVG